MYGAGDELWQQIGILRPQEIRDRYEVNRAVLIERMGHGFDRDWAAGRALSFEAAIAEALAQAIPDNVSDDPAIVLRSLDDLLGLTPMPGSRTVM